jgi:hypothetical protein
MIVFVVALAAGVLLAQQTPQQPDTGTSPTQQQVPTTTQEPPASTSPQTSAPAQTAPATQSSAPAQAATSEQNASRIAPGSIIPVRLTKTVDAKKAKQGDEIIATVPGDLKATNGQVLVPKDTKVVGHVTEAQKRSKEQKESQLGIAFDQMKMNDGQQVQLPMSIQAIIAPPKSNAASEGNNPPTSAPSGGSTNYPAGGGRGGAMGGNPSAPTAPSTSESAPANTQAQSSPNPPITEDTKGVVGIENLTLSATPDPTNGSVVTSEKSNVKLEDGTMMLLRVSPSAQQNQQAPQTQQSPQQK